MTNLLLDPSVMQFNGPCQHSIIYYILSFNRMKEQYRMQSQELVDSCWVGVWKVVFVSGDLANSIEVRIGIKRTCLSPWWCPQSDLWVSEKIKIAIDGNLFADPEILLPLQPIQVAAAEDVPWSSIFVPVDGTGDIQGSAWMAGT